MTILNAAVEMMVGGRRRRRGYIDEQEISHECYWLLKQYHHARVCALNLDVLLHAGSAHPLYPSLKVSLHPNHPLCATACMFSLSLSLSRFLSGLPASRAMTPPQSPTRLDGLANGSYISRWLSSYSFISSNKGETTRFSSISRSIYSQ
jgi:hypothetical protein